MEKKGKEVSSKGKKKEIKKKKRLRIRLNEFLLNFIGLFFFFLLKYF